MDPASVEDVQRAINAALAPAFLLAGAGALLNVLSQRRNRVVDRLLDAHAQRREAGHIAALRRRAALSLLAMLACIGAAALVCTLVAVSFLATLYAFALGSLITAVMVGAMLLLALGLCCFAAEAALARTDLPP
jgi:hypothetical protein